MSGIVGLGGGIGASRLWRVLARAAGPARLTLIASTAGDLRLHGLRVCPDIDTTLYALSGRQDPERGWEVRDESFRCLTALGELGGETWFSLGDLDLATHLYRTGQLSGGATLTEVTARLTAALGVRSRVLPMSDHDVTTRITTTDGRVLSYAEYLIREQAAPGVRGVRFDGIGTAAPAPGVLAAIEAADLIVLGPSNPVAGLLPILGLPGVTPALEQRRERVVAVSPVVAGVPFDNENERRRGRARGALLAAINLPASASGVARLYRDICGRFVYDRADEGEGGRIEAQGPQAVAADLLLHRGVGSESLLTALLGTNVIRP
ncbi:MAG TPA: 2-phospho-L-lactate transferase CofD family protein [Streptosporangiaceae bacterium]|nr:2-phospho-L-lactate transferase CofD family protein [Streptosporangiaceae bacterium]